MVETNPVKRLNRTEKGKKKEKEKGPDIRLHNKLGTTNNRKLPLETKKNKTIIS